MSYFSNNFDPSSKIISNITQANPGVVTTTTDHGYETGYEVRFFFPLNVGMNQLRNQVVQITVINDTSFSIEIDTSNFDTFSPMVSSQQPQVIPVGCFEEAVIDPTKNLGNIIPET